MWKLFENLRYYKIFLIISAKTKLPLNTNKIRRKLNRVLITDQKLAKKGNPIVVLVHYQGQGQDLRAELSESTFLYPDQPQEWLSFFPLHSPNQGQDHVYQSHSCRLWGGNCLPGPVALTLKN